jgi:hypothetical protein
VEGTKRQTWVVEKAWPHRRLWPADLTKRLEYLNGLSQRPAVSPYVPDTAGVANATAETDE